MSPVPHPPSATAAAPQPTASSSAEAGSARVGTPLQPVLETLLRGMEAQRPGALCSLMLLNPQGTQFVSVLAPSMSADYRAAVCQAVVGPGEGSCGTAAYFGQRVVVEDIASHPYWVRYRALAALEGVAACWSQPVLSTGGRVLGTFAIYYRTPRAPDASDVQLIEQWADVACMVLERDREANRLRDSEARYRTLVERSPDPVLVNGQGSVLYANPAAVRTFGARDGSELLGRPFSELVHPDQRAQQSARMHAILQGTPTLPLVESRCLRLDGTPFDVEVQGTAIDYQGQEAVHVVLRDITERKRDRDNLQLAASVFAFAREGIVVTDAHAQILDVNQAYTSITGYAREEVLGQQARVFRSDAAGGHEAEAMWQALRQQGFWSGEMWSRRKSGEDYAELVTVSAVTDERGSVRNYVLLLADITPIKVHQKQLEDLAHFDNLTHLPNRLLLGDRLRQAMRQAQRRLQTLAVVFLDLDGFKAINDRWGHAVGDELLIALAQRMQGALREGDTLARLGGDEFVAVLVDLQHPDDAQPVLERLLQAAADPVQVGSNTLQVSASMGIALYPRDGTHVDLLLRRADQSMYQAKQAGRNRFHFFDHGQDGDISP